MDAQQLLVRSLRTHSRLAKEAIQEISSLRHEVREFRAGEDVILQGQVPKFSAIVVSGMVARYHLLGNGGRQYLVYHLAGDLPDFQALFLREMDHGVCEVGPAIVAFIPHKMIMEAFNRSPSLGFAMWRETLIDARSSAKRSRTTAPGRSLSGWPICSANCSIVRGRPD